MADLPWIAVFALIALLGIWKSWTWVTVVAIFCMGAVAGETEVGSGIVGGTQALVSSIWAGIVGLLNAVAS